MVNPSPLLVPSTLLLALLPSAGAFLPSPLLPSAARPGAETTRLQVASAAGPGTQICQSEQKGRVHTGGTDASMDTRADPLWFVSIES